MYKAPNSVLVGCGAVGEILYSRAILKLAAQGMVRRVFAVDRIPERVDKVLRILRDASGYPDLSEITAELPDSLVVVALPHHLHARVDITAINAGSHVLCEKPMARTTDECDAILQAAANARRLVAVGHFRRFFPP
jgi:predicted dehydrogenase